MTVPERLPRPDLIFFDVGDTLVRAHPSWADVYLGALRENGVDVDRTRLVEALARAAESGAWGGEGPFEASREASYEMVKRFDSRVLADLGYPDLPDELFRSIWRAFAERTAWHVFEEVPSALEAVRAAGIRAAVISNWLWDAPDLLHTLELARHFEALIISSRVGFQKPHPGIFEHALAVTRVAPERAVHVGDSYSADVMGARAVGIQPVLIVRDHERAAVGEVRAPPPDVPVVHDLNELLDLIGVARPTASPVA